MPSKQVVKLIFVGLLITIGLTATFLGIVFLMHRIGAQMTADTDSALGLELVGCGIVLESARPGELVLVDTHIPVGVLKKSMRTDQLSVVAVGAFLPGSSVAVLRDLETGIASARRDHRCPRRWYSTN